MRLGALSPVYRNLTRLQGQCTRSPSSSYGLSPQSTENNLLNKRHTCLNKGSFLFVITGTKLTSACRCLPCVVSCCWFCCRSMVWVTSSRAESRLQQRGWSSLGGLMASSFSSADAELRRAGFLSRARSRKVRMARLQSFAMSTRGGACLWICKMRDT